MQDAFAIRKLPALVDVAANSVQARALLDNNVYDLVVSDNDLGFGSEKGETLVACYKPLCPDTYFILWSAGFSKHSFYAVQRSTGADEVRTKDIESNQRIFDIIADKAA